MQKANPAASGGEIWPRDALPRGASLYGYRIERILGRGGFGITYGAVDRIEQSFAVKECFPRQFAVRQGMEVLPTDTDSAELLNDCLERFTREAKALLQLSQRGAAGDGVVKVVTLFETNGTAYIVMEFLAGDSMETLIRANPKGVAEGQLTTILHGLLHAVGCAHDAGLLHRDIKPGNILLRQDGRPVLIDFGAVRAIASGGQTQGFTQIFSESYAPIEQITGRVQGPYSDIYAIGATCYRAIGGSPIDALTRHGTVASGKPDPMQPAASLGAGRYQPALLEAIDAALRVPSAERPQTVAELLELVSLSESGDATRLINAPAAASQGERPRNLRQQPDHPAKPAASHAPDPAGEISSTKPSLKRRIALFGVPAVIMVAAALAFLLYRSTARPPPKGLAAYLNLRTDPPGASLAIDGKPVGTSPMQYAAKPGLHEIEANLKHYRPAQRSVQAVPGQTLRLILNLTAAPSVSPSPPPSPKILAAYFDVITNPSGAMLSIDGQPVGLSPLRLKAQPGLRKIEASLAHYNSAHLTVTAVAGQSVPLNISLVAIPPDVAGQVAGVFSASRFLVGKSWVELYGVDQLAQNQHVQAFLRDITPSRGRLACYREQPDSVTNEYQCFSDGKDLALLELQQGVVQPSADAPRAYRLAARGQTPGVSATTQQ